MEHRTPGDRGDLDDARVGQELGEVLPHRRRRRRVGSAEADEQHPDVRDAVVRELGFPCSQSSASSRDSAFDRSFAVTSTIGITRSYAMRVGPITPSVPIT